MDFLQFADGRNSLKKISKLIKIDLDKAKIIYNILKKHSLVI